MVYCLKNALLHHLGKKAAGFPPSDPPGGPVKHPVYKCRAGLVSKLSWECVTGHSLERFGSSRQEVKVKITVKQVLLKTHKKLPEGLSLYPTVVCSSVFTLI
ncbi:hypothetical protein ILYODFUR_026006 [Ilyodon furcidens]|uniref:Uncharacterized protein n=1 Tax=Ilyodon furcidens TaxID=33524 RepID=A0ABV0V842_9TELE